MILEVGRVAVEMFPADCGVCRHEINGGFEPRTRKVWAEFCEAGLHALDIGAYTGLYAISAAKMGCKVDAFEPMTPARQRLLDNIVLNDVSVTVHRSAVSDRDGFARMHFNPLVAITSGASLVGSGSARDQVATVTVDSMGFDRIELIKIDVERAEALVIRGAANTIRRDRPAIILEVLDRELGKEILALLPDYALEEVMDRVNWLLLPC